MTTTAVRTVADNPAYAWRNSTQECLRVLDADFVHDYRDLLDGAAITAMALTLPAAWLATGLGFTVVLVPEADMGSPYGPREGVAEDWYWAAWDRAAADIDGYALVAVAGLDAEYAGYRAGDR